jgi:hypothetical protein
MGNTYEILFGISKREGLLEDTTGTDGMVIVNWVLTIWAVRDWAGLIFSAQTNLVSS